MAKKPLGGSKGDSLSDTDRQRLIGNGFDAVLVPLIILDEKLHILVANSAFNEKFCASENKKILGELFYEVCGRLWDITDLRELLEKVIHEGRSTEGYECEIKKDFSKLGRRILRIGARGLAYDRKKMILVSIFDVTEQRVRRAEREKLIEQKAFLIKEIRHRIANSLQLIANSLFIKAAEVSAESRKHLLDAHDRITAMADLQKQLNLDLVANGEEIEVSDYLSNLVKRLGRSLIGSEKSVSITLQGNSGSVPSATAISMGIVTTELVINALKHAFPNNRGGHVVIVHERNAAGWSLSVRDDGVADAEKVKGGQPGLGTSIIGALAKQLQAEIKRERSKKGTSVTLIHAGA